MNRLVQTLIALGRFKLLLTVGALAAVGLVMLGMLLTAPRTRVEQSLGRDISTVLARATSASTERFPPDDAQPIRSLEPVVGQALSPATIARLREAILSDSSYVWDDAKRCMFIADVAVTLMDDQGRPVARVALCFSCKEWIITVGERSLVEDFDPVAGLMGQIAAEAFPGEVFPPARAGRSP
jgi:hypothetical protein